MSAETLKHLNTNTLIGFTDKRGNAWHYRAEEQGAESNHYAGAIPVEDVIRRLFHWHAIKVPALTVATLADLGIDDITQANGMDAEGRPTLEWQVPDIFHVMRPDTRKVFGTFKGFEIHQYDEWLLGQVSNLLGDTLNVGSAGVLREGAVAWVSIEAPDNIVLDKYGVTFTPHLLAATSMDGSLSTTFKHVVTNVVCDNTMSAGLAEKTAQVKIKHSKYSRVRLSEARVALSIVTQIAENFTAEVQALCETTVTDAAWSAFLEAHVPVEADAKGRALTMATAKREQLTQLWNNDNRVSPWKGTGWGVMQAVNTWTHHVQGTRGETPRSERNMAATLTGAIDKLDASTVKTLDMVLAAQA
jgi:phage/plasmid-like protein (TIGR03299 family)